MVGDPSDQRAAVERVLLDGDGEPVTPAAVEEYALDNGALVARVTDHRESSAETEREVSFADPDDAVRERVRELGLSSAARSLDGTVRASKVADSNVDDVVQSQVADLVEAGDPDAFTCADQVPGEDEAVEADGDGDHAAEPAGDEADAAGATADGGTVDDASTSEADDSETATTDGDSEGQASMGEFL